jgi:hypothetical protein
MLGLVGLIAGGELQSGDGDLELGPADRSLTVSLSPILPVATLAGGGQQQQQLGSRFSGPRSLTT